MTNPIHRAIEQMFADQNRRNADILVAGEQCRKWREEEAGDCRSGTVATQASPGAATASPPSGECQLSQEPTP